MHDGTKEVAFTPAQLLRRLAALVPPPRWNQTRYFGVFAPRASARKKVVPPPALQPPASKKKEAASTPAAQRSPLRLAWAALLARVFAIDVLLCPCGGVRKLVAFVPQPRSAQEHLRRLGLPHASPPLSPPSWPSQEELELPRDDGIAYGVDPPFFDQAS